MFHSVSKHYLLRANLNSTCERYPLQMHTRQYWSGSVLAGVCLCCLSVCPSVSNFTRNYSSDLHENFTTDLSLDKEVKFWKSSRLRSRTRRLNPGRICLVRSTNVLVKAARCIWEGLHVLLVSKILASRPVISRRSSNALPEVYQWSGPRSRMKNWLRHVAYPYIPNKGPVNHTMVEVDL